MANIPSDALEYDGHRYYLFDEGMTWEEAKSYCESLGGHLVTITDENEQAFIENLLSEKGTKKSYWIGCKLNSNEEMYWVTEEDMTYSNWAPDEPDNYQENQGYGLILRNPIPSNPQKWYLGKWSDIDCDGNSWQGDSYRNTFWGSTNFGFICE